jgi:putative lipoic acid-binding regulatory protein
MRYLFGFSMIVLLLAGSAAAQAKRNTRPAAASTPIPEATPTPDRPKKNERPTANRPPATDPDPIASKGPRYRYEFTQPDFVVSHIVLVHDDNGKGTISFKKSSLGEDLSEPVTVSAASLDKLRAAFDALNFIDSTENYQFERDFSNMGNLAITLSKDGRERTAKYNWTSNPNAKILMDEYRRLTNQFVWMFDFNLARTNQPLETPKLVDSLDSLINRNEISDPHQLLPFLTAISNDERVPLIGRNRAAKIVQKIEKQKK